MKLSRLLCRDSEAPSLRERFADLKAGLSRVTSQGRQEAETGPTRRAVVAGTLATAVPVVAVAAAPPASEPHPDQPLLDAGAVLAAAKEAQRQAEEDYRVANLATCQVLATRPLALLPLKTEYIRFTSPITWKAWGDVQFQWVPPVEDETKSIQWTSCVWTGAALRHVIARAVPVLGRGGQTPHRIRRWRSLIPIADAFDARVEAIETETDYHRLRAARETARDAVTAARAVIEKQVATTPEGMAVLVKHIAPTPWKNVWGAWPALLRSAANVSGVDPASLEHEHASTRHLNH